MSESSLIKYFDADAVSRITAIGYKPLSLVEGNLVGNHRSPMHGFAVEFAGHRQYAPGDDLRHLDWKAYFKSDKYLIKQYAMETNFTGFVVTDVSETMKFEYDGRRKIDYAAFLAVAIASTIIGQNDLVSASFFTNRLRGTIPRTGADDIIAKISTYLEDTELKDPTSMGPVLATLAEQVGRRKCVFVISDFFDDVDVIFDGVKKLLGNRNEVILLHVLDPLEMNFDYPGQVELIELEGDGKIEVEGRNIADSYNRLFGEYLENMQQTSRRLGVDYILCDTSQNFGVTLAKYLNTRIARGI